VLASYGCTEMASQVATTAPGGRGAAIGSAGRCLPHRRLRVEGGQILVTGASLFEGYVTEEGIDDPRRADGWYPTGDRGRVDAAGRLYVLGRMDRMFVSGGENIHPEEIEAVLEQRAGIERAVVVPVPHPDYGARPVAFVEGPSPVSSEDLTTALADRLPGFKIPEAFHSLPSPDDADGLTVDREWLKRRARALRGPEDEAPE